MGRNTSTGEYTVPETTTTGGRKRCCCNCGHRDGSMCKKHNMFLHYATIFEHWCRNWCQGYLVDGSKNI